MREIVHIQAGQCGNQIGAKVRTKWRLFFAADTRNGRNAAWRHFSGLALLAASLPVPGAMIYRPYAVQSRFGATLLDISTENGDNRLPATWIGLKCEGVCT